MNCNGEGQFSIVTFLDSFDFPLREATRKEVWWEAKVKRDEGYQVTIYISGQVEKTSFLKDGIKISFIKNQSVASIKSDVLHCVTGSVSLWFPLFRIAKAPHKILTLTDGWMLGSVHCRIRRIIAGRLFCIFDEVNVFSEYQKGILKDKRICIVKPHLPKLEIPNIEKSEKPTVLYMGHISKSKGFDAILQAIRKLLMEDETVSFIVANNMIQGDKEYIVAIEKLSQDYPNQVIIKGIVNPLDELKKAWVYIYPFISPMGTMAFPLSLYESEQCETPFVACDVSANSEFFDKKFLIEPDNSGQLFERIKFFIDERKVAIGLW